MKEARTAGRINGILVASGAWHDIDFARLEILKLLAEFDRVRIRVFEDYENLEALVPTHRRRLTHSYAYSLLEQPVLAGARVPDCNANHCNQNGKASQIL